MLSRMDDMEKKFASLQDNALLKNKVVGEPNSLFSLAIEKQLERYSKDIEYKIMVILQFQLYLFVVVVVGGNNLARERRRKNYGYNTF